jgi:uncharacterized repeat protein (TIGR03803 family)
VKSNPAWEVPLTNLTRTKIGFLICAFCVTTIATTHAQTFTKLFEFNGNDGIYPWGYLAQGPDGNFYGMTIGGGSNSGGTVFRITPQGKLKTVYNFCALANCTDGASPQAGLILAYDGNFYGTTSFGGDPTCSNPFGSYGCGTLFKISPEGKLTTLHTFELTDGANPLGGLVESGGSFFGTTSGGGEIPCGPFVGGCGTVFKITAGGTLTTLHAFDFNDGASSDAGLAQADDGTFYGTTELGGVATCNSGSGCGTAFRITGAGVFTTLNDFQGGFGGTGSEPNAPVIQATDGNLYGTTFSGMIFEINKGNVFGFYQFNGGAGLGAAPSGLVQGTDGNLYGSTFATGDDNCNRPYGCGTLYQLTLAGVLLDLHNFEFPDGAGPYGAMLQSTNGSFYGSTGYGGKNTSPCASNGCGTIYSLDMGLGAFVAFVRPVGGVGQEAAILGQGFTGTTAVSFNGIPATFNVQRDTFLMSTVPAGATTGYVTVTTPSGTLTSNVPFHVLP